MFIVIFEHQWRSGAQRNKVYQTSISPDFKLTVVSGDTSSLSDLESAIISAHDYIVIVTSNQTVGDVQSVSCCYPKHTVLPADHIITSFHRYSCVLQWAVPKDFAEKMFSKLTL